MKYWIYNNYLKNKCKLINNLLIYKILNNKILLKTKNNLVTIIANKMNTKIININNRNSYIKVNKMNVNKNKYQDQAVQLSILLPVNSQIKVLVKCFHLQIEFCQKKVNKLDLPFFIKNKVANNAMWKYLVKKKM